MKIYQETYGNFLGIFARILACIWVQSARKKVHVARKFKKTYRSLKPTDLWPKPTDLMDPDQTNAPGALDWSRSIRIWIKRLRVRREWVGFGSTRPRHVYKRGFKPVFIHFPKPFLFLLFFSPPFSLFFTNPNPKLFGSTQKLVIHGLNDLLLST